MDGPTDSFRQERPRALGCPVGLASALLFAGESEAVAHLEVHRLLAEAVSFASAARLGRDLKRAPPPEALMALEQHIVTCDLAARKGGALPQLL